MMIQIDMKNWRILLSYFVLSVALGYLVPQIKRSVDAAKWRREQQALWSRHFLENYPNRLLTYCDVIYAAKNRRQEVMFVEWRDGFSDYARPRLTKAGEIVFELLGKGSSAAVKAEEYNKGWRCWLNKPVEEETKKAPAWKSRGNEG